MKTLNKIRSVLICAGLVLLVGLPVASRLFSSSSIASMQPEFPRLLPSAPS